MITIIFPSSSHLSTQGPDLLAFISHLSNRFLSIFMIATFFNLFSLDILPDGINAGQVEFSDGNDEVVYIKQGHSRRSLCPLKNLRNVYIIMIAAVVKHVQAGRNKLQLSVFLFCCLNFLGL